MYVQKTQKKVQSSKINPQEPSADRRAGFSKDHPHQLLLQEVQVGRARHHELQLLLNNDSAALPEER